jgi:hypothetical protein
MVLSSWITAGEAEVRPNANPVANPGWSRVRGSDRAGTSGLSKARSSFRWSKSRRVLRAFSSRSRLFNAQSNWASRSPWSRCRPVPPLPPYR